MRFRVSRFQVGFALGMIGNLAKREANLKPETLKPETRNLF
jgi:hypothetical protein